MCVSGGGGGGQSSPSPGLGCRNVEVVQHEDRPDLLHFVFLGFLDQLLNLKD